MNKYQKTISLVIFLLCPLLALAPAYAVQAQALVGISSPDEVSPGYSFTVAVTATGAYTGVDAVQLYLQYPEEVQFVKAESSFCGVLGSEVESTRESIFDLQDKQEGVVQMLSQLTYRAPDDIVALLVFVAKPGADPGAISFRFVDDSFVMIGGEKVPATTDSLVMKVVENVEEGGPSKEVEGLDDASVPEDEVSEESPSKASDGAPQSEDQTGKSETTSQTSRQSQPTVPPTEPTEPKPSETETPLRSVTGEPLYVPESGLPVKKIPPGYQGSMTLMKNVNIPIVKKDNQSFYYLRRESEDEGEFYIYETGLDRFRPHSFARESETKASRKANFAAQEGKAKSWQIILVSLIALSSLSIMIYTIHRNLHR